MGKVVKLGPGSETSTVKVGDRVGIKWVRYVDSTFLRRSSMENYVTMIVKADVNLTVALVGAVVSVINLNCYFVSLLQHRGIVGMG